MASSEASSFAACLIADDVAAFTPLFPNWVLVICHAPKEDLRAMRGTSEAQTLISVGIPPIHPKTVDACFYAPHHFNKKSRNLM
jgi:hypothetical protein